MPAAYAHHKFGEICLELLSPKLREVCLSYRELYDIGVHGPDTLFYYKPLRTNEVNRYGNELHHWTGEQFFFSQKENYQTAKNRKAALAYLLGFLAHFTLDSSCHDYINEMAEKTEYSHNLIESQYEAFLMRLDGKDPLQVDRSLSIHPTRRNANVIANIFPFAEEEIRKSLRGQKNTLHLFYSPYQIKKKILRKVIKLAGVKGDFGDLFLDRETIEDCQRMNEIIYERHLAAEEIYPKLAKNLIRFFYDKEELDAYFAHDFEGILQK